MARRLGSEPEWSPLPVQYADYAVWQEKLLGGKGDKGSLIARQLDYWTEALCDLPEQLSRHRLSEAGCCQLSGRKRVVSDFA